jgi:co-chaperonin GroES (HSP10)
MSSMPVADIRPLHDWLLVRLDPIPEKSGSIFLTGSGAVRRRTATVLRVGPGRWDAGRMNRVPVGVEPDDKVTFWREHLEHQQGKQLVRALAELGDDLGLIRSSDVLYAERQ